MISPFPVSLPESPYFIVPPSASVSMFPHPPTPESSPWHSPTLGHQAFTGPRASPPIDVWLGHPLHIRLEPWVSPCVLFDWWFSPWELWGAWLVDIVANPFSSFSPFSNSSIEDLVLSPMVACEHLPLYLPGSGRATQETAISGSCQQAILGICNSVWVWCLHAGWIPQVGQSLMAFPSVSVWFFASVFPLDRSNSGLNVGDEWPPQPGGGHA